MLKPGDPAPDFTLVGLNKEPITLNDYKGKPLVLLFFPFAFSSTCTEELCMTRDDIEAYNDLNAQILAVSVDSHHALAKFKEVHNLNFTLASDFDKSAIDVYGVRYGTFGPYLSGVAKRSAFVIDSEGIVQHMEVLENASEIPDFGKVKEALSRKL